MQSLTKLRTTCASVAHSASLKRVFWKSNSGLAEGLALLRVLDRQFDRALDHRGRRHAQQQALVRQLAHQLREALAFLLAEQVVGRHAHAVEEQLGGVGGMLAELLQPPADAEARQVFGLQHDQRDAAAAGVAGAHRHHQQVGA